MKEDSTLIFKIASDASKAVEYLLSPAKDDFA